MCLTRVNLSMMEEVEGRFDSISLCAWVEGARHSWAAVHAMDTLSSALLPLARVPQALVSIPTRPRGDHPSRHPQETRLRTQSALRYRRSSLSMTTCHLRF